jgi:cytoskeleton protein RodZ
MASFGKTIRTARECRRITLADVSRETKIGLRYLTALECNDFRKLPGGGLNRGYVRSYAKFIGADPEAMVRAFVAEEKARGIEDKTEDLELLKSALAAAAQTRAEKGRVRRRTGRRSRIFVVATLLAVAVLTLAGWDDLARELRHSDRARHMTAAWSDLSDAFGEIPDVVRQLIEPEPASVERKVAPLPQQERVTRASVGPSGHLSVTHLVVESGFVDHQMHGRSGVHRVEDRWNPDLLSSSAEEAAERGPHTPESAAPLRYP